MMPTKSLSLGSLCCYISAYAKGDQSISIEADRSPEPKSNRTYRIPRHSRFHLAATAIDGWLIANSSIAVAVDDSPAVPRVAVDRFGVIGFVEGDGGFGD
jgi:hypothetical protein